MMQIEVRQKPSGAWTVFTPGLPMSYALSEEAARKLFSVAAEAHIKDALSQAVVIKEPQNG